MPTEMELELEQTQQGSSYESSSVVTELVDLIEPHDHLNSIYVPKCDGSWRVDYHEVMLVFKASGISSRFGEVKLSLIAFNPQLEVFYALSDNQVCGP
uniref:Uncharacterized protein n=1 Tax=Tanacetum cinerariifolium TaxID=118510 RepID=A0A699KGB4_TANCI|nr:hypothetical protein [Tanacetum cinerariifolium]